MGTSNYSGLVFVAFSVRGVRVRIMYLLFENNPFVLCRNALVSEFKSHKVCYLCLHPPASSLLIQPSSWFLAVDLFFHFFVPSHTMFTWYLINSIQTLCGCSTSWGQIKSITFSNTSYAGCLKISLFFKRWWTLFHF